MFETPEHIHDASRRKRPPAMPDWQRRITEKGEEKDLEKSPMTRRLLQEVYGTHKHIVEEADNHAAMARRYGKNRATDAKESGTRTVSSEGE
jgi:ketosteroid isomerase-like protein